MFSACDGPSANGLDKSEWLQATADHLMSYGAVTVAEGNMTVRLWAISTAYPYNTALALAALGPDARELVSPEAWDAAMVRIDNAIQDPDVFATPIIPPLYAAYEIGNADRMLGFLTPQDKQDLFDRIGAEQSLAAMGGESDQIDAAAFYQTVELLVPDQAEQYLPAALDAAQTDTDDLCTPPSDSGSGFDAFYWSGLELPGVVKQCDQDEILRLWDEALGSARAGLTAADLDLVDTGGKICQLAAVWLANWPDDKERKAALIAAVKEAGAWLENPDQASLISYTGLQKTGRALGMSFPVRPEMVAFFEQILQTGDVGSDELVQGDKFRWLVDMERDLELASDYPEKARQAIGDSATLAWFRGQDLAETDAIQAITKALKQTADNPTLANPAAEFVADAGSDRCSWWTKTDQAQRVSPTLPKDYGLLALAAGQADQWALSQRLESDCGTEGEAEAHKDLVDTSRKVLDNLKDDGVDMESIWNAAAVVCALSPDDFPNEDQIWGYLSGVVSPVGGVMGEDGMANLLSTYQAVELATSTPKRCKKIGALGL
jgi:hypothetical protein